MTSIYKLFEKATNETVSPRLEKFAEARGLKLDGDGEDSISREEAWKQISEVEELLYSQFTGRGFDGERLNVPTLSIKEALTSSDASILFPRVISEVLLEPTEPNLFLTNSVADIIELPDDSPTQIEFPVLGALQAFDMAEGGDYPQQTISIDQHMTRIRLRKIGISTSVTEEVIARSMWPIVRIQLRLMSQAIDRRVEAILFQAMTTRAQVVFDNENASTAYHSTGKSVSQDPNYSFSFNDLVKMAGVLLGNKNGATHFLAHPLTWPIFAQDPIMRAQFYNGGQLGASIWSTMPKFDQTSNFPWGIAYVPYYAINPEEGKTLSGVASGLGPALVGDLYLIDSSNSLFMATRRGGTEMDQMENWYKDAMQLKARKYAGVSAKDGGKGMVRAKNIRIVPNNEAIFTVNTASV